MEQPLDPDMIARMVREQVPAMKPHVVEPSWDGRWSDGRSMSTCDECGFKRCPRAENTAFRCTDSNAVGQVGELDTRTPEEVAAQLRRRGQKWATDALRHHLEEAARLAEGLPMRDAIRHYVSRALTLAREVG